VVIWFFTAHCPSPCFSFFFWKVPVDVAPTPLNTLAVTRNVSSLPRQSRLELSRPNVLQAWPVEISRFPSATPLPSPPCLHVLPFLFGYVWCEARRNTPRCAESGYLEVLEGRLFLCRLDTLDFCGIRGDSLSYLLRIFLFSNPGPLVLGRSFNSCLFLFTWEFEGLVSVMVECSEVFYLISSAFSVESLPPVFFPYSCIVSSAGRVIQFHFTPFPPLVPISPVR